MKKQIVAGLSMALLAAGCASSGKKQDIAGVPNWVTSPSYKDGIAATECVPASSNFSLDRKEAIANARQGLAQQLNLKVKAMDKTYQRRTRAEDKASTGSSFESVSRQVTETNLNGSRVVKTGYVELAEKKNLCVMVAFGDSEMQKIFDDLIDASGRNVSPQDEDILYQEFKAKQAGEEMDKELAN
jgi:hypothetical protein